MMRGSAELLAKRAIGQVRRILPGVRITIATSYGDVVGVGFRLGRRYHGFRIGRRARKGPSYAQVRRCVAILRRQRRYLVGYPARAAIARRHKPRKIDGK
jgi:hypothetical protein